VEERPRVEAVLALEPIIVKQFGFRHRGVNPDGMPEALLVGQAQDFEGRAGRTSITVSVVGSDLFERWKASCGQPFRWKLTIFVGCLIDWIDSSLLPDEQAVGAVFSLPVAKYASACRACATDGRVGFEVVEKSHVYPSVLLEIG
jgi:hypothetical protein